MEYPFQSEEDTGIFLKAYNKADCLRKDGMKTMVKLVSIFRQRFLPGAISNYDPPLIRGTLEILNAIKMKPLTIIILLTVSFMGCKKEGPTEPEKDFFRFTYSGQEYYSSVSYNSSNAGGGRTH